MLDKGLPCIWFGGRKRWGEDQQKWCIRNSTAFLGLSVVKGLTVRTFDVEEGSVVGRWSSQSPD
jgi:hypothetical protein